MVAEADSIASRGRFQILSLDGGGVRGIFSAALLAGIERDLGRPVVSCFDLVVGTSTGGIIAAAFGAGVSADDMVDLYTSNMTEIFPGPHRLREIRRLVRPKYRAGGLERVLRGVFGDQLLGESRVPLVIPSFDVGENSPHLFKTPHHERLKRDWRVPFWQVAMATSAAPTYFPAFCLPGDGVRLVDGGVWANNPAMVGVAEAVSLFGQPLDTIRVLSIGTTSDTRTRRRGLDDGGLVQWFRSPKVTDVLLRGQSIGAFTQVLHLLGADRAYRLDPPAPGGLAQLDRADARDLTATAACHSRVFCPTFEAMFADHTPFPYRPLHGPNAERTPCTPTATTS
jgi:patatin-like phospholipase/acyl hydrolase